MLPIETLMRAAEGGEREAELVRADFLQAGLEAWVQSAIERRLDPALGARVVPAGAAEAVSGALEAFYALWGRWRPSEYRRVRREWLVLRTRWRGDAPVDPPPPVDPVWGRSFSKELVDASSSVVPARAGELEAGLEPREAPADAGGLAGPAPGAAMEKDSSREPDGAEVAGGEESSPRGDAPLVGAGGPVPARLPDGTEVLAGDGGLPLSAVADRLDQAVRRGVAAVEEVRAAWLGSSGAWHKWPAIGRWQERSR